jgi:hypothetical protein
MPADKVQDLSDILAASVETQNSPVSDFIQHSADPDPLQLSDDFEEPKTIETETEKETISDIPLSKEALKKASLRWIGLFDHLQKPFLVNAYSKAILKPGDTEALTDAQKRYDLSNEKKIQEAVSENDHLYGILKRFDEYQQAIKGISFTEEEKEMIAEPLAEVVEIYKNMHMSPQMALLAAVAMVMLPRIEPIFPQLFKGIKL